MLIMKDGKVGPAHLKIASSPSYTLKEIEALAKEWAKENEATNDARWIMSGLLSWLARREREGRG